MRCKRNSTALSRSCRSMHWRPVAGSFCNGWLIRYAQTFVMLGVKVISISGAKGKKLTTVEDWESETYRDARRYRSAVESLMFTIKDGFAFGELGRRGIEAVRDELLEKVLAYNCCRSILLRQRQREELEPAA